MQRRTVIFNIFQIFIWPLKLLDRIFAYLVGKDTFWAYALAVMIGFIIIVSVLYLISILMS